MKKIILLIFTFCLIFSSSTFAENSNSSEVELEEILQEERYGWSTAKERQYDRNWLERAPSILEEYDTYKLTPTHYAFDSLLLPGRAQMNLNQTRKALIFRAVISVSLLYGAYEFARSEDFYNSYQEADNLEDIEKFYDESNTSYKRAQIALGIGTATWIYNIYDAYQGAKNYNRNLYNRLRFSQLMPKFRYDNRSEAFALVWDMRF